MEVSRITEQGGALDAPVSLMEKYLNDPTNDYRTLKFGDVMDGTIMRVDRDEILVDIGSKSEGIVPAKEFSSLTSNEKQALSIGETVLIFVVQPENQEGHAVVSIDRARQEKSWRRLQESYEENGVIEVEVAGARVRLRGAVDEIMLSSVLRALRRSE